MTGRVKVSYAGRPPFWLFFQPEQSVADLETQAIQSLDLPSSHDEHGAVGLTFLLDGCELLKKTSCAMLSKDDMLELHLSRGTSSASAAPAPATAQTSMHLDELPSIPQAPAAAAAEPEPPYLPPPPLKRRKLAYDTERLYKIPLPDTLPFEEVLISRIQPAPRETTEQEHRQLTAALLNGNMPADDQDDVSDGDFRPDFGEQDDSESEMDTTDDDEQAQAPVAVPVQVPQQQQPAHSEAPQSRQSQEPGLSSLVQTLTNPTALATAMQTQTRAAAEEASIALAQEQQPVSAPPEQSVQYINAEYPGPVSPAYFPPSPPIRVATPPAHQQQQQQEEQKRSQGSPPKQANENHNTSKSQGSTPSSSDDSSSSESSSSSSSSSSSDSDSDSDDEDMDTSAVLKPAVPKPQPVQPTANKKVLAGANKTTAPGQGSSKTAKRNARRRNAKRRKNAILGGADADEEADDSVASAKAAALSVLDRVAHEDAKEDQALSAKSSKKQQNKNNNKQKQTTSEVLSQHDLASQLQQHQQRSGHVHVVPPSEKQLPSNVFVTSVDVEMPREEEQQQPNGHEEQPDGGGTVVETVQAAPVAAASAMNHEDDEADDDGEEESPGWEGWPSLTKVVDQWRHLKKVTDPSSLSSGAKVAFQILELSLESFSPEFVLYHGQVTSVPPPVTSVDANLLPTMADQDPSLKAEWHVTVALHPTAIRPDDEVQEEERVYSWNDLADCRMLS